MTAEATPNPDANSSEAGEARVRAMSTEVLKRNQPACEEALKQWGQMARGDLDAKPHCPFCEIYLKVGSCPKCSLHIFCLTDDGGMCGETYWKWQRARDVEYKNGATVASALHAAPVRVAAGEMEALLGRLLAIIEDELANRRAIEIDEAYSREAATYVEEPKSILPADGIISLEAVVESEVRKWLVRNSNGDYCVTENAEQPTPTDTGGWWSKGCSWLPNPKPTPDGTVYGIALEPGGGPVDVTEWFTRKCGNELPSALFGIILFALGMVVFAL